MLDNQEYLTRIKRSEGFLSTQRRCPAGFLSIGYGYNLERYGSTPKAISRAKKEVCQILGRDNIDNGITEAEAQKLLQRDLNNVIEAVKADKRLGPLFEKLDDERQFVLIDMCYNMGVGKVKKFNKMLTAMENGDYDTAAREIMRSKYAKDVGRRARDNAACMVTGEFEFNTTRRIMKTDRANATKKSQKETDKVRKANAGTKTKTQSRATQEQQQAQPQSKSKAQTPEQSTPVPAKDKSHRTTDTSISAGDERRMRSMLRNLNKANGKSRQVDVDATIEALSARYGADADRILAKAMMAPTTVAKKLNLRDENGKLITSSRKLIQRLCELEDEQQKQNVVTLAKARRRRTR